MNAVVASEPESRAALLIRRYVLIIIPLCLLAAHAGGLGIAPLMAITGGVGLLSLWTHRSQSRTFRLELWMIALFAFLFWGWITSFWSSYRATGLSNPVKLLLGVGLYCLGVTAIKRAAGSAGSRGVYGVIIAVGVAALLLMIDTLSGYGLSLLVDPVNVGEDPVSRLGDAQMNVSQGLVSQSMLFAPIASLILWTQKRGPLICIVLALMVAIAALFGDMWVAILALVLSMIAMSCAYNHAQRTIRALFYSAMGLIAFAPLFGALMGAVPQTLRDILPFSWEHRLVSWGYTAEQTRGAPILGHGFDASRSYSETFSARGFDDIPVISLHPHNAGLQIWLETGLVGAMLAVATLWFLKDKALNYADGGRARSLAISGFLAATILIASVSYGVWQDW